MEKYRRRNFLINKDFQLKYCFYVCSWLFTLSFIYPFIIYQIFDFFIGYMEINFPGHSAGEMVEIRGKIVWLLGSLQLVFLSVTFLISIFISHRIAGPIFKLCQWFEASIQGGKIKKDLFFRKHDYFKEVAESYNEFTETIEKTIHSKTDEIEKSISSLNDAEKTKVHALLKELKEITTSSNPV